MQFQFSNDVAKLQPSAIREILKFTSMPGVISFAAGNPAPEAFPTELIADLSSKLLREHPVLAMQYSITEGYPELREQLKQWMTEKHCSMIGGHISVLSTKNWRKYKPNLPQTLSWLAKKK